MRIVVAVGLPGSGKSTWLAQFAPDVLSSDAIRAELTGDAANQTINERVFSLLHTRLGERLAQGKDVTYIDATNLIRRDRRPFIRLDARVEAVWFDTPTSVCLARNATRDRRVPAHVIERMAAQFIPPSEAEGFHAIQRLAMPAANTSGLVSKLTTA